MWVSLIIAILVSYFLGNHNGAVLISALLHDDVRTHGSGNAGLTNFIRNYGAGKAVYVLCIDGGKAVLACLVSGLLLKPYGMQSEGVALGGLAVMLGHNFPVLLGFRGGKGILSGLFIALSMDWRVALIILAVFVIAYFATQYVSLGSVLAAAAFSVSFGVLYWGSWIIMTCGIIMGALAVFMHRGNIVRLVQGNERKTALFGKGNKQ